MSHWLDQEDLPESTPHAFIQWKGTDVCLDFYCPCGEAGHFDGFFAYVLKCPTCGRYWEMPHHLIAREATNPDLDFYKDSPYEKVLDIE